MDLSFQQMEAVRTVSDRVLVAAGAGSGKAQPINTVIPTPKGYRSLKELKIGDFVFDRLGKPTKVTGIFPQGVIDNYKITLSDGRTTYCNNEHLWSYYTNKGNLKTVTIQHMLDTGLVKTNRSARYNIPTNRAVQYEEKIDLLDPYVVGVFLGDGCCTLSALTLSSADEEIVKNIAKNLSTNYQRCNEKNYNWVFPLHDSINNRTKNLQTIDIFNKYQKEIMCYSYEKCIPSEYKHSSIEQRLSLLQGLMDTDGSIYCNGDRYTLKYTTTSKQLAIDTQEILYSLGYQASISEDNRTEKYTHGVCYNLTINISNSEKYKLFRLTRKREIALQAINIKQHRNYNQIAIRSIEKMENPTEMLCISVDNDEHLYLTNDFIVTHNTRVLVERIKYLIETGVEPSEIYAITYTNMAAQEMLERLYGISVFAGTLHSLANQILISNGYDTSSIIKEEAFGQLLSVFQERHIELPQITHLLVDEFQDICDDECEFVMDTLQAENIFLVGDSCQSIYGFKGANFQHFMDLVRNKQTSVHTLSDNYRNGHAILTYANQYLEYMDDVYRVRSTPKRQASGEVITETFAFENLYHHLQQKKDYGEWFILCRTNRQIDEVLNYLKNKNIPCDTFKKSEKSFTELKDLLKQDTVKVLTIHSSKGLESKNVIVIGMRKFNNEEKRIAYVACTRAKDKLIVEKEVQKPRGRGRNRYGGFQERDYHGETIVFGEEFPDTIKW